MGLQAFFISQKSPRALLQGTANVINSDILVNPVNIEHLHQFCQMLQKALNIELMNVLLKTLSSNDTLALKQNHHPFLSFKHNMARKEDKKELSMKELSSHPVHLKSKNAPSAFIPFCAYNIDLLALGAYI